MTSEHLDEFHKNLSEFRNRRNAILFIFISILLTAFCITNFIPNLFKTVDDFKIKESTIESIKSEQRFLHVQLTNGSEWRFSEKYSRYWPIMNYTGNIGKPIKLWYDDSSHSSEPVQIKIDNKIIYPFKKDNNTDILMIFLTIGVVIYTAFQVWNLLRGKE